jgi:hypothetical protein
MAISLHNTHSTAQYPLAIGKVLADPIARACSFRRFWDLVKRTSAEECWRWAGTVDGATGHGLFRLTNGVRVTAHLFAWLASRGAVPAGQSVQHLCATPSCVNPNHLFLES